MRRPSPAVTDRADRHREKRRRQQRTVLDHAQRAVLLAHEQTPVGRELHGGRARDASGDGFLYETRRHTVHERGCPHSETD